MRPGMTCRRPDRDEPKLLCGYPIPCPWHTVVLDTTTVPPTVSIPVTSPAMFQNRALLADVADALGSAAARRRPRPRRPRRCPYCGGVTEQIIMCRVCGKEGCVEKCCPGGQGCPCMECEEAGRS